MPILCGPADAFDIRVDAAHQGLTEAALLGYRDQ
jgi:hypothetical protein